MSNIDMGAISSVDESATVAILWLMIRYQKTGCKKVAYLIEQHLDLLGGVMPGYGNCRSV